MRGSALDCSAASDPFLGLCLFMGVLLGLAAPRATLSGATLSSRPQGLSFAPKSLTHRPIILVPALCATGWQLISSSHLHAQLLHNISSISSHRCKHFTSRNPSIGSVISRPGDCDTSCVTTDATGRPWSGKQHCAGHQASPCPCTRHLIKYRLL